MTVIARVPRGRFAYWEKRFAPFPRRSDTVLPVHYLDCPDSGRILGFIRQPIQTLIIDLQQTTDAIMAVFRANTRNEIRRAEREAVLCRAVSSFDRFLALYEGMSYRQALPPTPTGYLQSLGEHLCITEAVLDGNVVLQPSVYCGPSRGASSPDPVSLSVSRNRTCRASENWPGKPPPPFSRHPALSTKGPRLV
jgi:hypothetical protein